MVRSQEPYVSTTPISREKRKVLVNALSNVTFFVTQVVVVFFVSPILVHGLGDSRYGVWLLVNSLLGYMALADLGVGAAVVRYVARFDGLRDAEATNRVFSSSQLIFGSAGILVLAVTLVLTLFWEHPFGVTGKLAGEMRWLLALLGANLAVGLPMSTYRQVLVGLSRYPAANVIRVTLLLLRNAAFVLAVHCGGGLRAIGVIITAGSILNYAWSALAAHHYLPSLRFSFRFIDRATFRTIWSYSTFVFLAGVAFKIGSQGSTIVVGAFLVPAAITYFGIASSLTSQAGDGLRTAIAGLTPAVSKWDALGDHWAISRLLVRGTRYVLFLALPIQLGLIFLGHPFIALWMGPRYADLCYPALVILSLPVPLTLVQAMSARILEGVGKVAAISALTTVQAVLMIAISVALVRPLGIEGAAWGIAVPSSIHSIAVAIMACRASHVRLSAFFIRACALPALAASFLAVVWLTALWWFPMISSWRALFGIGLAGLAVYLPVVACLDVSLRSLARQLQATLWRSRRPCQAVDEVIPAAKES